MKKGLTVKHKGSVQVDVIKQKIYIIRGKRVMIDKNLAEFYEVENKQLKRQVRRNLNRFPEDFMIVLSKEEYDSLRCQNGTLKRGQHSKYLSFVFTEQGVAMLSSILNSEKAIEINIQIMRAFVQLRQMITENEALKYAIEGLEGRVSKNERNIQIAIKAIQGLMNPPEPKKLKRKMGFTP